MHSGSKLVATALAALLGLNQAALADPWVPPTRGPVNFLAKPGVTLEQRTADQASCREIVSKADGADLPQLDEPGRGDFVGPAIAQGGVAGAGAALILIGIFAAVDDAKATRRGNDLCMYNMGYRTVPMTKEEIAAYAKVKPAKQRDWERNLLPADTEARLAPLLKPVVPRLPAYDAQAPLVDGGIRAADLTLAAAEIQDQGVVVKGTATRRRTAVLVAPFETENGAIRIAADAGTVFHLVDNRTEKEPMLRRDGSTWCASMRQMAAGNVAKDFYCITGRDYGYEIVRPSGQPWLAGPYTDGLILPVYTKPIQLDERAEDDLGKLDLELKVLKVENSDVVVAADARHAGKTSRLWVREISFGKDGTAVLPLWDSKLTMTKLAKDPKSAKNAKGAIKAELTHDGDGSGWRVGKASPSLYPVAEPATR